MESSDSEGFSDNDSKPSWDGRTLEDLAMLEFEDSMLEDIARIEEAQEGQNLQSADVSLEDEILAAIEPFTRSNHQPYFSPIELAVMAVLCSDKYEVTNRDVSDWIVKTFQYYMKIALDDFYERKYARARSSMFDELFKLKDWAGKNLLNCCYDVPLQEELRHDAAGSFNVLKVDPHEGRIFLRDLLEPKRKGTFRFFDLPAEIRVTIYEYVFSFPPSGIAFGLLHEQARPKSGDMNVLLVQRAARFENGAATPKQWPRGSRPTNIWSQINTFYLHTKSPNEILALLSVNKRFYEEAMP